MDRDGSLLSFKKKKYSREEELKKRQIRLDTFMLQKKLLEDQNIKIRELKRRELFKKKKLAYIKHCIMARKIQRLFRSYIAQKRKEEEQRMLEEEEEALERIYYEEARKTIVSYEVVQPSLKEIL